jgi:hypothetical protein
MDTQKIWTHSNSYTSWFESPQQQNANMWLWIQTNQTLHHSKVIPKEDIVDRWQKSITHVCLSITSYYFHKTQLLWWYATHDEKIDEPNMVAHVL